MKEKSKLNDEEKVSYNIHELLFSYQQTRFENTTVTVLTHIYILSVQKIESLYFAQGFFLYLSFHLFLTFTQLAPLKYEFMEAKNETEKEQRRMKRRLNEFERKWGVLRRFKESMYYA